MTSASHRPLIDTGVERNGLQGIALRGEQIEATVFPEPGGKILDLVHRRTGTNVLWQNPRVPLQRTHAGAPFDDLWCGGWDELFPTDPPCELDGSSYHDHGDLWIGPWEWKIERNDVEAAVLYLRRYSVSLPCRVERWISLERDAVELVVRYRLTNLGTQAVRFQWTVHVAHAIGPSSRLYLPATTFGVQPPYLGRAQGAAGDLATRDLSVLPEADSGLTEFFFTRDLSDGWCTVAHQPLGLALTLTFDRSVFPRVWLFGVYGGWRGHYFLLTEPSTSNPGSLRDNVAAGTAATLDAGASLETAVIARIDEIDAADQSASDAPWPLGG